MYYAAVNSYATETSIGFANTWGVVGFATRQMRDAYVRRASDLATRPITSKEIAAYGGKRGQISYYDADGNLHQHMQHGEFCCGGVRIDPVTAKSVKWIACATHRNLPGKPDYTWTRTYTNGAPVVYSSAAEAIEAAQSACADAAHGLYDPRAIPRDDHGGSHHRA